MVAQELVLEDANLLENAHLLEDAYLQNSFLLYGFLLYGFLLYGSLGEFLGWAIAALPKIQEIQPFPPVVLLSHRDHIRHNIRQWEPERKT